MVWNYVRLISTLFKIIFLYRTKSYSHQYKWKSVDMNCNATNEGKILWKVFLTTRVYSVIPSFRSILLSILRWTLVCQGGVRGQSPPINPPGTPNHSNLYSWIKFMMWNWGHLYCKELPYVQILIFSRNQINFTIFPLS